MGLFDRFKKGPSEYEKEHLEKWWKSYEYFRATFKLSSVLLEGTLKDAGFDEKQKATFDAAILLGILNGIDQFIFHNHISEKLLLGSLNLFLTEDYDLENKTANEIVHMVNKVNADDASFIALRECGSESVSKFLAAGEEGFEAPLKPLALDLIYENKKLVDMFKREYKPL